MINHRLVTFSQNFCLHPEVAVNIFDRATVHLKVLKI